MTTTTTDTAADLATARAAYRDAFSARVGAFGSGLRAAELALKAAEVALKAAQAAHDAVTPAAVAVPPVVATVAPVAPKRTNPAAVGDDRYSRRAHCEGSDDIRYTR